LRLRPVGTDIHGEAEIKVSRTLSIDRVSAIRHAVAQAVVRSHPDVKMTVTAEPVALDDETIAERILLIANRRHVPVHHLTVQTVDGRHSVSFDAEVDGRMTLGQAHEIVTALEGAIADELGSGIEVESHIEPLDAAEIAGADVAGPTFEKVKAALATRLHECSILSDVHALRVRHTDQGLVVNYHCLVDPALPVAEVHAHVDTLDRKVRQDCPDIARIVGHAEPIKARDHN
jgi:divalent metal cation (Fe/Co/Zn/Cd) transporter